MRDQDYSGFSIFIGKNEDYGAHTAALFNHNPALGSSSTILIFQLNETSVTTSRTRVYCNTVGSDINCSFTITWNSIHRTCSCFSLEDAIGSICIENYVRNCTTQDTTSAKRN